MSPSIRATRPSQRRRPRWRPAALAWALAAILAPSAQATDHHWTGGAGSAASFWDLAVNWTPGLPAGVDARALLGRHDTTLRSGEFSIGTVHGRGRLHLQGGSLRLHADGSELGALHLDGGTLQGPGRLQVGQWQWDRGSLGPIDPFSDPAAHLVVTGPATIGRGGDKYVGYGSTVELRGATRWLDGDSAMTFDGRLLLGAGSRFEDHVAHGSHALSVVGGFVNHGTYVKTGAGTSSLSLPYAGPQAENRGALRVAEGRYEVHGAPADAGWHNSGRLEVARGAAFVLDVYRGSFSHTGRARIDGAAELHTGDSRFDSTGQWEVGRSGTLRIANGGTPEHRRAAVFAAGTLRNEGLVRFEGGESRFGPDARLTGPGRVEVARGAVLRHAQVLSLGALTIDSAVESPWHEPYWGAVHAPSLHVQRLDWGVGDLHVPGRLTVSGVARLYGGPQYWTGDGVGPDVPAHRKRIDGTLVLGGGGSWSGETDITGTGRLIVSRGRAFRDETAADLAPGGDAGRPVALGVAVVENHGLYAKTGAGRSEATGRVYNAGRVVTVGTGAMIFSGPLDNRGALEARGARIDVRGGLAQWQATQRRLAGGTYLADGQTIGLNLGGAGGLVRNSARVELRGAGARLVDNHAGLDRPALATLAFNDGSLRLMAGAGVATGSALRNTGDVTVAGGSRLASAGSYTQASAAARTWIDGTLQAAAFSFEAGVWGAGLDGTAGRAWLRGGPVTLWAAGQLDVDILGGTLYDVVSIDGGATLGGTLHVDFGDGVGEGSYRVLTAAGGLAGSFASLLTDLDPTVYQVEVHYGSTYLDLVVRRRAALGGLEPSAGLPTSPVPEPHTYALMLTGLGALVAHRRRRPCDRAG